MARDKIITIEVGHKIILDNAFLADIKKIDGDKVSCTTWLLEEFYIPKERFRKVCDTIISTKKELNTLKKSLSTLQEQHANMIDQRNDLANQLRNTQSKLALSEHPAKTSIDWSVRAHELTLAIISAFGNKWDVEGITQCVGELLAYQKGCCDE